MKLTLSIRLAKIWKMLFVVFCDSIMLILDNKIYYRQFKRNKTLKITQNSIVAETDSKLCNKIDLLQGPKLCYWGSCCHPVPWITNSVFSSTSKNEVLCLTTSHMEFFFDPNFILMTLTGGFLLAEETGKCRFLILWKRKIQICTLSKHRKGMQNFWIAPND